jgi:hypothetical protein
MTNYQLGPYHLNLGGWHHDDYDGAPDAGDTRCGVNRPDMAGIQNSLDNLWEYLEDREELLLDGIVRLLRCDVHDHLEMIRCMAILEGRLNHLGVNWRK